MAHLTKPLKYDIEDSNIALFGSDLEKCVHEHAGDKEHAWDHAGTEPGLKIWRIEQFSIVDWPKERYGSFYNGDSYIVLNTYKKDPESDVLSYDLHFWLGEDTSQDEAGTAAYKTVELDDHLQGRAVQQREVQGSESPRFLSYFRNFVTLRGGAATGFHHVSTLPPPDAHRLYRIGVVHNAAHPNKSTLVVREVVWDASSLVEGDVFVIDKGTEVWQLNTKASAGKEKYRAAEFAQSLVNDRRSQCIHAIYDEGGPGAGVFLSALGVDVLPTKPHAGPGSHAASLYRLSDSTGTVEFEPVSPPARGSLSSSDAFLLDYEEDGSHSSVVFVWLGQQASIKERRLALQYAQAHLYRKRERGQTTNVGVRIVKMNEGSESDEFSHIIDAL